MKKLKTQKGITLVALIITIVVLLILAAVAIGAVRDSDIIGYAQNAADSYETEKGKENEEIRDAEDLLNQYAVSQQALPKLSAEEKEELLNLINEYADNKYANFESPTEEQLAIANRAKSDLLAKGLNLDETVSLTENTTDFNYIYYFHDKKVIVYDDWETLREASAEEIEDLEELYKRAKVVDEKLESGDYTNKDGNLFYYYFDYNGESLEFEINAGTYYYTYNERYQLCARDFRINGRCLGF